MADDEKRVRLTVMVKPEVLAKVEELAKLFDVSSSAMGSRLIEAGLQSDEWIARLAGRVRGIVKGHRERRGVEGALE